MTFLIALFACAASDDSSTDADATIEFLSPEDGSTVAIGDVDFSVVVENFALVDLAKHTEGESAEGYIGVSIDGVEAVQTSDTQFTLTLATAGTFAVDAELFYGDDGDALDEPAVASLTLTVE